MDLPRAISQAGQSQRIGRCGEVLMTCESRHSARNRVAVLAGFVVTVQFGMMGVGNKGERITLGTFL